MRRLLPVERDDLGLVPPGNGADIRWLTRRVLPAHPSLSALPTPVRVSTEQGRNALVRDYLVQWARNPEAGGAFESATRELRELPDDLLLHTLQSLGYDGLLYANEDGIVGHAFYQRHGDALHGFSVAVNEPFARKGYAAVMVLDYLAHAARMPGIVQARIGRGEKNVTRRVLQRLQQHADAIGWRVHTDGWVFFPGR